jgi:hypothetical protein
MGWTCNTHQRGEKYIYVLVGHLVRIGQKTNAYRISIGKPHMKRRLEHITDARIILKCMSEESVITLWRKMIYLRIEISDWLLWNRQRTFGFPVGRTISNILFPKRSMSITGNKFENGREDCSFQNEYKSVYTICAYTYTYALDAKSTLKPAANFQKARHKLFIKWMLFWSIR